MSINDLKIAVDWAAAEGWNPGLDDADAFHAVDPEGFLMGWIDDQPATAISVVRHSDRFGFLGFYLCHPDYRGKGLGWQTWQAGMALLGDRIVGLDGVPAQQANYERSGFRFRHQTQRFGGRIDGQPQAAHDPVAQSDLDALRALDLELNGTDRRAYISAWFTDTAHRKTLVHRKDGKIISCGTIRACRTGHKIGPLFAADPAAARNMIQALVYAVGAHHVYIDVPETHEAPSRLMLELGLRSEFSCARMYRGPAPERDLRRLFGEVSFELG